MCQCISSLTIIALLQRWLVKKNKLHKAITVLKKIYNDDDTVSSCLEEISGSVRKTQYSKSLWRTCFTRDIIFR